MCSQVLDITRTLSRVGKGNPTGIDRVEHAYIKEFLRRFSNPIFIAKIRNDIVAIHSTSMQKLVDCDFGENLSGVVGIRFIARLKLPRQQRLVQSFLWRNAIWKCHESKVQEVFALKLLNGFEYTNVGHSHLSYKFLCQLKPSGCSKIRVMIHDLIPIEYPEFCRDEVTDNFKIKMKAVMATVDDIICNSSYTRNRIQDLIEDEKNHPNYIVAYLGVESVFTKISIKKTTPNSFIILGTIEVRKNHALLLDVWQELALLLPYDEIPILHMVGKRGWKNGSFFQELSRNALLGKKIYEHNNLSDDELNKLMNASTAMLFPSFTEGYGLPAIEALSVDLPVICSDIPVFREILLSNTTFVESNDPKMWAKKVLELIGNSVPICHTKCQKSGKSELPTWSTHFRHVFN